MEFSFADKNKLSEAFVVPPRISSIHVDEITDDNLNLFVVPQYGRNPDESG
uniref:Proxanthoxycyclin-F n=1 Tax=Melicope xanthoxyloides TaxID=1312821 RepID=A0A7H9SM67_9ROSI|nr:proxanthoxycyclin-F [Melicope xanthoxyloides]